MSSVSLYPYITELRNSKTLPFHELMEAIRSAPEFEQPIAELRATYAFGATEAELSALKNKLPYFTGSGIFSKREDAGLIQHSGKLIIDFDKLESYTTMEQARKLLIADKYTEYLFTSCTGRGLAVVVNIEPDPAKHLDSFLFLEDYYLKYYNLKVDKACKDVSRPRYISYDPELHNSSYFETVKLITNSMTVDNDEGRFDFALNVHNKKHEFVEGNRHNYLVVLAFWLNKCGVSQDYTYDQFISRFAGPEKTEKEIQRIVRDCYKNTTEHGTFVINKAIKDMPPEYSTAIKSITGFAYGMNDAGRMWSEQDIESMCKQHYLSPEIVRGIFKNVFDKNKDTFGIDHKPELERLELFINKTWEIKHNSITHQTQYRKAKSSDKFEVLNTNTIFRRIQHAQFKLSFEKIKSLLRSDFIKSYNPFHDYFNSLPDWDGTTDYITPLADHITTDDQLFWQIQFKKALVRSIACSIGGRENRIVMTLVETNQETGKSSFIRFLCPAELQDYYTEAPIDNSKDSELQLCENFIQNLDELASMQNNEINKLKSIISRATVKQRKAYGEFAEKHPRRVNFWASTNRTDFLTDDQNTRWLCFNVLNINHDYDNMDTKVKNVDINLVWAQAWSLYKSGFNYNLNREEKAARDNTNRRFELATSDKHLLQTYFAPGDKYTGEFLNSTEIMMRLISVTDGKLNNKLNIVSVGRALRQLQYTQDSKRIGNAVQKGYWVVQKYTQLGDQISMHTTQQEQFNFESKIF